MWPVGSMANNVIFNSQKVLNKNYCPPQSSPVSFVPPGIRPPSLSSVKSHVMAVLNLKDAGLAALKDINHLSGRKPDERQRPHRPTVQPRQPQQSATEGVQGLVKKRATSLHLPHSGVSTSHTLVGAKCRATLQRAIVVCYMVTPVKCVRASVR